MTKQDENNFELKAEQIIKFATVMDEAVTKLDYPLFKELYKNTLSDWEIQKLYKTYKGMHGRNIMAFILDKDLNPHNYVIVEYLLSLVNDKENTKPGTKTDMKDEGDKRV